MERVKKGERDMYKVIYNKKSGRNIFISFSKGNYRSFGFDKPHKNGCCICWAIHLGKLHIESQLPNNSTELK